MEISKQNNRLVIDGKNTLHLSNHGYAFHIAESAVNEPLDIRNCEAWSNIRSLPFKRKLKITLRCLKFIWRGK